MYPVSLAAPMNTSSKRKLKRWDLRSIPVGESRLYKCRKFGTPHKIVHYVHYWGPLVGLKFSARTEAGTKPGQRKSGGVVVTRLA